MFGLVNGWIKTQLFWRKSLCFVLDMFLDVLQKAKTEFKQLVRSLFGSSEERSEHETKICQLFLMKS